MTPKKTIALTLFLTALFFPTPLLSEEEPATLEAKVTSVSLFKNGVVMAVLETELPENSGHYRLRPLPYSLLGSFWIGWPENVTLSNIKATQAQTQEKILAASIEEILEANIGQTLDLRIQDKWARVKIVDIPHPNEQKTQPQHRDIITQTISQKRSDVIILEASVGIRVVPKGWIQEAQFPSTNVNYHINRPSVENVLEFTAQPADGATPVKKSVPITLTVLSQGAAWAPSYVVDISKKEKAQLSSKSIIINDLMPWKNTHVELIAGFPHIEFDEVDGAFSLQPIEKIIEGIRSRKRSRRERYDVGTQVSQPEPFVYAIFSSPPTMPSTPVMGESAEDLYFYPVEDVTLKKGERGYYPLFAKEIPYEHIYTWEIPNYLDPDNRRPHEESHSEQTVWHSLRLKNTTGQPWTTAPAMTVKDGHILGQDTIPYTPPNALSDLKIAHALSIKAEQKEYETDRQRNVTQLYNMNYDLVTIQGELELTNYKNEDVTVEIKKTIVGDIIETTGDPKTVKLASSLRRVNSSTQIIWTVTVKPGIDNKIQLKYSYLVYTRA